MELNLADTIAVEVKVDIHQRLSTTSLRKQARRIAVKGFQIDEEN